jgi:hypothetical protein
MDSKPFAKLKFPIHEVPHGTDLLHKFSQLNSIQEFREYGNGDRNKVIRYIIYCYDLASDFIEKFPNLKERKEACLIESGIERNKKDEFDNRCIQIMDLSDEAVRDMINGYLRFINNRTWMMLVSTEEMFSEYQKLIMKPISTNSEDKEKDILSAADIKKKLREECNIMDEHLKRYYQEIFGDNEDLKEQHTKKKRVTPESIAKSR